MRAHTHGRGHKVVEDIQRNPATYDRLVMGSFILGRRMAEMTPGQTQCGRAAAQCHRLLRDASSACMPSAACRPCSTSPPVR